MAVGVLGGVGQTPSELVGVCVLVIDAVGCTGHVFDAVGVTVPVDVGVGDSTTGQPEGIPGLPDGGEGILDSQPDGVILGVGV